MGKKYFFLILLILNTIFIANVFGAEALTYSTLKDGVSIRGLTMGNALTAYSQGPVSLFYNPSGLAVPGGLYRYDNMDYKDENYKQFQSYLFYRSPIGIGNWKKQTINGDMCEVTAFGFGKRNPNGVSWGLTYKNIREDIGTDSNDGWSSDLGATVYMTKDIHLGFLAQDILSDGIDIPTTFRGGFSFSNQAKSFIISSDIVYHERPNESSIFYVNYGAEYNLTQGLVLRGGVFEENITAGFSLALPIAGLEYGIMFPQDDAKETIYMVGFTLGKGVHMPVQKNRYALFKPKAFAIFRIGGNIVSGKSEVSLFGGQKIGSNDLITLIHEARKDPSCEGFLIRVGSLNSSLGAISLVQEIRNELKLAKQDGKKIVVYIESWASLPEYYLASVANKIVMPELASISHLGIDLELVKSKRFLNKFGFDEEVLTMGIYKGSMHPTSKIMTSSQRMAIENVIHSLYRQVLYDIKADRTLKWTEIGEIFDGRVISAINAQKKGLIDELGYWELAKETALAESNGKKQINTAPISYFFPEPETATILSPFNRIAIIEIDGAINLGANSSDMLFGGKGTGADEIDALIDHIKNDFTIKGVLLRVNSPGGSLLASDRIFQSLEKLRKAGKPVYTSMGNLATSGAYFIALNSDKIYANPGTLTGSIGVISVYRNKQEFNELLGFDVETFKTGKYMDMFSENRKMTKEEKKLMQDYQVDKYNYFVDKVKEKRNISTQEAQDVAQGQLFTGKQAKELKLVDDLGNFYDAVQGLSKKVKIKDPNLVYYRPKPQFGLPFLNFDLFKHFFGFGQTNASLEFDSFNLEF